MVSEEGSWTICCRVCGHPNSSNAGTYDGISCHHNATLFFDEQADSWHEDEHKEKRTT